MSLHQTSGRWRLGLALSLITVLMWGILPLALTITLQVLDVYTITWFRFLMAFGLLALFLATRQEFPSLQQLRSASLGLLAIATLFLGGNYLLFLQGLGQTSPTNAQVLIQLAPMFLGLGALVVFKERYTLRQWIGVGILVLGFTLFFHDRFQVVITSRSTYLLGNMIIVLAAVTWAIYALAQKQLLHKLPSTTIMLVIYGGCAVLFTPLTTPQSLLSLSPLHLSLLLFCGLNTLIAYGAFAEALEHWQASRVSAVLALTPLVTLSSVWIASRFIPRWVAPEQWTGLGLLGAMLVVSGSIAIALGRRLP